MARLVILGNSGSGKSTLAQARARAQGLAHLDLDTIAFRADAPGVREELAVSRAALAAFFREHSAWVVEGCYTSLLENACADAEEIIFLNPGVEACQANCRARPWEPHKYPSKAAQDANLAMLLAWVADYETRTDEFSLRAHRALFDAFAGRKTEYRARPPLPDVPA